MRKSYVLVLLLVLAGCSVQSMNPEPIDECAQECERYYTNLAGISELLGMDLPKPYEVICSEPLDCTAKFKIDDTIFDLYYYKNESTEEFYKNFNHEMMHINDCSGELCDELNEFHYIGPPRRLEVTCKDNLVLIKDKSQKSNHTLDCEKLKTQNKYNPRTWVCDFNDLVKASCS